MAGTWADAYEYAMQWIATPTPYELGGEGTQPGQPVDCSKFVQDVMAHVGITFTRTTQTQWADPAFAHQPKTATPQPGWIVYYKVPSDGGDPPQHVGLCISATEQIEAPHTGEDVMVSPIPNTAGESIYGFIVPPYAPPPAPAPTLEATNMLCAAPTGYYVCRPDGTVDSFNGAPFYGSLPGLHVTPNRPIVGIAATPTGLGYWLAGADGGLYCFGDAKFLGSLPGHPQWNAGTVTDPCVGICVSHDGGYTLACDPGGVQAFVYDFPGTGIYAAKSLHFVDIGQRSAGLYRLKTAIPKAS